MRTIDPTLDSYKTRDSIFNSISENIYKLYKYNEKVKFLDGEDIKEYNILAKKIIVVIPENTKNDNVTREFRKLDNLSEKLNIKFEVVEFGVKE